jgi:hypothetical protein
MANKLKDTNKKPHENAPLKGTASQDFQPLVFFIQ